MKLILKILLSFMPVLAYSQTDILLPRPQYVDYSTSQFEIGKIKVSTPVLRSEIVDFIKESGGTVVEKSKRKLTVSLVKSIPKVLYNADEAYTLNVSEKEISISATTQKGIYWALQTLRQLKKNNTFVGCNIVDFPAFRIRGFMQDVGRTYISVDELKREIAKLSQYKINVFHWHLTENQAWRLQSKRFPQLTDSANMTRMSGKFYTLAEAQNLVDFCKKHNVTLIPEIDMPGHSAAFERAFGCDMQSEKGMKILKELIDEICETFDTPYLHIGTDEVKFTNQNFVPEMVAYIRARGKRVISWNPGWKYKVGEIDMTQLWSYRGAAQQGIPAVDSRFHYLNHFDTFGDIIALYNSKIYNVEHGDNNIAGVICAVWNDRFLSSERNIILENNFYPNMLAIAERAWRGGGSEYFDKNGTNLMTENIEAFSDFERRMLWHKENNFKNLPFAYVKQTNVHWAITDAFPNDGNLQKSFPPELELKNSYMYEGNEYKTKKTTGAGIYLRHVWGNLIPAFYKNPQENHTAYAYTWVFSPVSQNVGLWVEFQNYSRSEADLSPPQGKWDYKESRIWINDEEIFPSQWTATHTEKSNETPLGNENCVARNPVIVKLNTGWNKVLLKLPVGKFSIPQVRLVKWAFTAVFVTPDGEKAVDGLIYSPEKIK